MTRSRWISLLAFLGVILLSGYLLFDATSRRNERPTAANERGTQPPTAPSDPKHKVTGVPQKEATCRTTPAGGQPAMSHEDCAFIAATIPVLPSQTSPGLHADAKAPTPLPQPGSEIPSDVQELKPLPDAVTQKLTALRGYQYYLSGEDIVVVGNGAKVAFVVDVRVRP
jgi:hypothetical protein